MTDLTDMIEEYATGQIEPHMFLPVRAKVQFIDVYDDYGVLWSESKNMFCKEQSAFEAEVCADLVGDYTLLIIGYNGKHYYVMEQKQVSFEEEPEEDDWFTQHNTIGR